MIIQRSSSASMDLRFTICFGVDGDRVLMLYRRKEPNQQLWNGLGGKIEPDEAPLTSVQREIFEEAGVRLPLEVFRFTGIVTWPLSQVANGRGGMYAYVADMTGVGNRVILGDTREGRLEWKSLEWVCDVANSEVVDNIPLFLPTMLKNQWRYHFACDYRNHVLHSVAIEALPEEVRGS